MNYYNDPSTRERKKSKKDKTIMDDYRFKILRIQHLVLGTVHILLGIASAVLPLIDSVNTKLPVYVGIPTWIDCIDYAHEQFYTLQRVDDIHHMKDYCDKVESPGVMFMTFITYVLLRVEWFVFAFFVWTGLAHLFYATIYVGKYRELLDEDECLRIRWLEYGVSAGIMIGIIAYLSGIQNVVILGLLFKLFYILIGSAFFGDRLPNACFIMVGIFQLWLWVYILLELILPHSENISSIPWFVYVIYFTEFVLFNSFAIIFVLERARVVDVFYLETSYNILSFVSKAVFMVLLYSTVFAVASR